MTHLRRPNRRPNHALDELLNGGLCPTTGKLRFYNQRTAELARDQVARKNPTDEVLEVYRHAACGDWHIGHGVSRGKAAG